MDEEAKILRKLDAALGALQGSGRNTYHRWQNEVNRLTAELSRIRAKTKAPVDEHPKWNVRFCLAGETNWIAVDGVQARTAHEAVNRAFDQHFAGQDIDFTSSRIVAVRLCREDGETFRSISDEK